MEPTRILVVANRTAAAPRLLDEVRRRAEKAPCEFALLIPDVQVRDTADWTLEVALPLLRKAARKPVEGIVGGPDAIESVRQELAHAHYDEIIVSTLPRRFSRWINKDLIGQIEKLGLPVTTVTPHGARPTSREAMRKLSELGGGQGLAGG
jgi:hypothetical protein